MLKKKPFRSFFFCEQQNVSLDKMVSQDAHPLYETLEDEQALNPLESIQINDTHKLILNNGFANWNLKNYL